MLLLDAATGLISTDSGIALGVVLTLGTLIWAASSTLTDMRVSIKALKDAAEDRRREDERKEREDREWEAKHTEWRTTVMHRLDHIDPPADRTERSGHWRTPPRDH